MLRPDLNIVFDQVTYDRGRSRLVYFTGGRTFAYDVKRTAGNLDHFARFVRAARGVRRDGSAALDLCYVAAGRLDGFWELSLNPWDVCAGALVLEEAGGRVTSYSGGPLPEDGGELVASNGLLHDAMLALLR